MKNFTLLPWPNSLKMHDTERFISYPKELSLPTYLVLPNQQYKIDVIDLPPRTIYTGSNMYRHKRRVTKHVSIKNKVRTSKMT